MAQGGAGESLGKEALFFKIENLTVCVIPLPEGINTPCLLEASLEGLHTTRAGKITTVYRAHRLPDMPRKGLHSLSHQLNPASAIIPILQTKQVQRGLVTCPSSHSSEVKGIQMPRSSPLYNKGTHQTH